MSSSSFSFAFSFTATAMEFTAAQAINTRTVRVTADMEPQHETAFAEGDMLNPATWTITRLDTGQVFTVLEIVPTDSDFSWDIITLEDLGPFQSMHRVETTTLRSVGGGLVDLPAMQDFFGVISVDASDPLKLIATRRFASRDIKNLPAPNGSQLGGTLLIAAGGDYANEDGPALVKKLILRRLFTKKGEFFHLPQYGLGFTEKEPLPDNDLTRLKKEVTDQVLREPEVSEAKVTLTMQPANGIMIVQIAARIHPTGQVISVSVPLGPSVSL